MKNTHAMAVEADCGSCGEVLLSPCCSEMLALNEGAEVECHNCKAINTYPKTARISDHFRTPEKES
jgi:primosomal protein N'